MDPQLLALLAAALRGNSGVSGLLGNIDNPLLAVLAGVYDPIAAQGGQAGSLYNQYNASRETNPEIINSILASVESGANPYEIESEIDRIAADNPEFIAASGMTPETLTAMAKDMQGQYTSGQKQDVFSKAGLRNPADVYTMEDVPLPLEAERLIASFRESIEPTFGRESEYKSELRRLAQREQGRKRKAAFGTYEEGSAKDRMARLAFGGELSPEEELKFGGPVTTAMFSKQAPEMAKKALKDSGYQMSADTQAQARALLQNLTNTRQERSNAMKREQAVREGVLRSYEKSGQTPLKDQMNAILRTLSYTAKPKSK